MFRRKGIVVTGNTEFIAGDDWSAITYTGDPAKATIVEGRKLIVAGTIYPANDATALGVVAATVDVTDGPEPIALIDKGKIYADSLPVTPSAEAKKALNGIVWRVYNRTL